MIKKILRYAKLFVFVFFGQLLVNAQAQEQEILISELRLAPVSELAGQSCHARELDDRDWQSFRFPNIQPQQHLCIRGKLIITDQPLPANPTLLFLALAAYEIYLDGELTGKNGVPGNSAETEQVGGISSLLPLETRLLAPGEHLVSIELSSFHAVDSFAAIAYALLVIDREKFYDTILYVSIMTALLTGALLVMFVIFITLFLRYSRSQNYLIFAFLCLFTAALLVAEQWKLWVNYPYDLHLFRLHVVIAITLLVTSLLPVYYLSQHAISHKASWLSGLVLALLTASVLTQSYDARSEWLFIVALVFAVAINFVALLQKQTGAATALILAGISLAGIVLAPRLFLELGFGLSISLVLASIGASLLNQLVQQRNLALESGKVKGELLRRNLQPHYLMNCLMQVQELIDFAPKQANEFVQQLAEEFRTLVKMSDKDLVTLEDELQLCLSHLKIMSVRYQQDYQLDVRGESTGSAIWVPCAIIHSQIENCFTHNRITTSQPIVLNVKTEKESVVLELVTPIESATEHQGVGVGDAYIRAKMAQVCKPGWLFTSQQFANSWVTRYRYCILPRLAS